jgi:hypothetical protein
MKRTDELARIEDELRRAYDGFPWHGPSLREVLTGVSAATAARGYPQLTHSIWGLVNHLAAWVEVVVRRITENQAIAVPEAGDFPPVTDSSEASWSITLENLDRQHRRLLEVIAGLSEGRLDETVPGKDYVVALMLHGTAQHYAYHAGQIALLKKLET